METRSPLIAATDFSGPARHAVDRAALLAAQTGLTLTLMHAIPAGRVAELQQWLGSSPPEALLHDEVRVQLQELADELRAERSADVRTMHTVGDVTECILIEASTLDAALIVVGASGAGFLRRFVPGTTAERLLRRSARPVLLVRREAQERYRRVLVAIDFSPVSALLLETARRWAPQAQLVLLHAFEVPFASRLHLAGIDDATMEHYRQFVRSEASRRLNEMARAAGLDEGAYEARVVEGDASRCIVQHEQEEDGDLVVLGKHGQSVVEDLLLGSVTLHVLSEGGTDVLVCAEPQRQV